VTIPALEARGLSVSLRGRQVLRDVSVGVSPGEWLGVVGPNGAGKTTMLRALAGLVNARGEAVIGGCSVGRMSRRALAKRVALVAQKPVTPVELTVAEYVLLGRTPYIGYLATERRADRLAAESAMARLSLRSFATRTLGSLSGGELQRVVLARALAQRAPLLLLDEPTSALDIGHQQQAMELVDHLRSDGGLTIIAAMHDLTLAAQYADRILMLDAGHPVALGEPAQVLSAEQIGRCYGVSVEVVERDGDLYVLPRRTRAR
jgi:iron complex transport system ATP-binding protein